METSLQPTGSSARGTGSAKRVGRGRQVASHRGEVVAVGLREASRRIGIGYSTAQRLISEGRFPIPALPRLSARSHHRFSTSDIEAYLLEASTVDVRVKRRRGGR